MDKFDRYPGETDAELRSRIISAPIIKQARTAIWRVYGLPDKDRPTGATAVVTIGGKPIAFASCITHSIGIGPIDTLDRYEVVEIVPSEPVQFSCSGFRTVEIDDE